MGCLTRREDYDSPWKTLLENHFQAFLEWFFPAVAADVNWARGFEFLDKELQKVTRQAATGRRYADKLVKVWRQSGEETWVLVHVEIQAQLEEAFAERMFVYYYRLFDRYRLATAGQSGGAGGRTDGLASDRVLAAVVGVSGGVGISGGQIVGLPGPGKRTGGQR